jgi:hypothetical protein
MQPFQPYQRLTPEQVQALHAELGRRKDDFLSRKPRFGILANEVSQALGFMVARDRLIRELRRRGLHYSPNLKGIRRPRPRLVEQTNKLCQATVNLYRHLGLPVPEFLTQKVD